MFKPRKQIIKLKKRGRSAARVAHSIKIMSKAKALAAYARISKTLEVSLQYSADH